jgi:hypothetical protein
LLQGEDIGLVVWVMWSVWSVRGLQNGELCGVRRRGGPRKRCFQDVKDDLRRMRIVKWKEKEQERDTWRLIVKEGKAHQGL